MLSEKESTQLLDKLCIKLGFCLPPDAYEHLASSPPADVLSFTDAVFEAEGMNPAHANRQLYRQLKAEVADALQRSLDATQGVRRAPER